mgnify:CR=1 FL=1
MLINLTGNYFVLRRLLDFIAQSFYGISQNDVGVENRNNDTGMCGPMKATIRDVLRDIQLASAIAAIIHSFRSYSWMYPFTLYS